MNLNHRITLVVCLVAYSPLACRAVPLGDVPIGTARLNVESVDFVGEGDQTTHIVVDFGGAGGSSFAFGYRHDGATAEQMLIDFQTADIFEHHLESFSFGPALRGMEYLREEQADVFTSAFGGERSWSLWEGEYSGSEVSWGNAAVGINGVEFGQTEPTIFLPDEGFYGLTTAAEFPGEDPRIPIPGDFDSDEVVDGDDLLDLLLGFGTNSGPTLTAGDADRDGDVDRDDFKLWREGFGTRVHIPLGASQVPEPTTCGMLVVVALAALIRYRHFPCRRLLIVAD